MSMRLAIFVPCQDGGVRVMNVGLQNYKEAIVIMECSILFWTS